MPPTQDNPQAQRDAHWHSNLRLTAVLLLAWFAVSFVVAFYARELNARWFGWPFGFWVAAQGAPLVYVLLVWFYARWMRRRDLGLGGVIGVAETDADARPR